MFDDILGKREDLPKRKIINRKFSDNGKQATSTSVGGVAGAPPDILGLKGRPLGSAEPATEVEVEEELELELDDDLWDLDEEEECDCEDDCDCEKDCDGSGCNGCSNCMNDF